ncbi:MAG: hypothetical protein IK058_00580 [Bacteroidales bacterium]|nr:hypothetical protein [Bacteroidales bacterium]
MKIEKLVLIVALVTIGTIGTIRAQATLNTDTIPLGDQTVVSVPAGAALSPSEGVVVLGQTLDTVSGAMQAVVTSFEPGEHWLHVGDDSLLLVVTDVEVDTTSVEIRDIAPIERVPYTFWELFRWVLLAWAVAAVAIVVWWLVDRKKRHGSIFVHHEPVDTRNPFERASDSLEELREKRLWQSGKVKEYHTELTDIVRRFIEEAMGIRATDMTSDETVEAVGSAQINTELLRDMFTTADLVKFAKSEPLPHEHEASLKAATTFVGHLWEQVKPQEEEEAKHE